MLSAQDVDKEIFVTVDEPTPRIMEEAKQFEGKAKFVFNKERIGKANALNETVKLSSGKALLFLDSDIEPSVDPDYLKKIVMDLEHSDILDIKKEVVKGKSFLSKMAYYEYFTYNISSWLASRYMHQCPAVNGAAFAMKREAFEKIGGFAKVIPEDIDLATRAFLKSSSFAYTTEVEVKNYVHQGWKNWFNQRRRWAIAQAIWLKMWYLELAKKFFKKPQVFLPSLFFLYPSVAVFLLSAIVPSVWMYNSLLVFSLFLSVKFNLVLPVFLMSLGMADIIKTVIVSLSSFGITATVFYVFSRKIGFKMKIHELLAYYFFYSTIWIVILVIGHIQVFFFKKNVAPGWKT